jgi:hypothetical protein
MIDQVLGRILPAFFCTIKLQLKGYIFTKGSIVKS